MFVPIVLRIRRDEQRSPGQRGDLGLGGPFVGGVRAAPLKAALSYIMYSRNVPSDVHTPHSVYILIVVVAVQLLSLAKRSCSHDETRVVLTSLVTISIGVWRAVLTAYRTAGQRADEGERLPLRLLAFLPCLLFRLIFPSEPETESAKK